MHENTETPYLILELDEIERRYRALESSFGRSVEVFYSVKANNHPAVIKKMLSLTKGLDVASLQEIETACAAGAKPFDLVFSNPVKKPSHIKAAFQKGVRMFAFDSEAEIIKLATDAPGADVYVRISVPNEGSVWPLTKKFGVGPSEAIHLLKMASEHGLNPIGTTFHVGSQCLNVDNWERALTLCKEVFDGCRSIGINLSFLDIGGGIPAQDAATHPPEVKVITERIGHWCSKMFDPSTRIIIEPGRYLTATSGTLVASIIGKAERFGSHWIHLDVGIWCGMEEVREGYPYELIVPENDGKKVSYTVAGPTCDSVDVMFEGVSLPEVEIGDRVHILNAGAYTISMADYNGFGFPSVILK